MTDVESRLNFRINELESENRHLRGGIADLEDEVNDLNDTVMELENNFADLVARWNDKNCLLQQIGDLT